MTVNELIEKLQALPPEAKEVDVVSSAKLYMLCAKFIANNQISVPETIYQTDRVAENSLEFIEEVCEIVGYCKYNEDE